MSNLYEEARLRSIAYTMDNPKYSDLIIKCEDREWHVHKVLVCTECPLMEAAIAHGTKEAVTSTIVHQEYDADTMERLLSYIYTSKYHVDADDLAKTVKSQTEDDPNEDSAECTTSTVRISVNDRLIAHARVFGLADYYNMPLLKCQARCNFLDVSDGEWELDGLIDVVREVNKCSSSTDRQLRDVLKNIASSHLDELIANDDFMSDLAELEDVQMFAVDMFKGVVKKLGETKEHNRELQQLLTNTTTTAEGEKRDLQRQIDMSALRIDELRTDRQQDLDVAKGSTKSLIAQVKDLPQSCKNSNCSAVFDLLTFGGKGYWPSSHWWIRCANCRCRLNK